MRMLCAAESGPLAPPQPWRSAAPHSAPSLPAAHFSTELFSLAARARTSAEPVSPEQPHQGVASKKAAPHQAEIARNSTTALGLSWHWQSGTAPGARVTYDYDAWGNTINTTGSTPNVYLYRGEQYDADLAVYYLRARYFNAVEGRMLSRDPKARTLRIRDPRSDQSQPGQLLATPSPAPKVGTCATHRLATRTRLETRTVALLGRLNEALGHAYLYGSGDPVNRIDPTGCSDAEEEASLQAEIPKEFAEARKAGVALKEDVCYVKYWLDTADCGTLNVDDWAYETCMGRAWLNLYRCDQGLPPVWPQL